VRIMLVDDHAGFRQVVKMHLQTAGVMECLECESGDEGVARYSEFQPEVVLMDIEMAGLDGLSATARIKARFPDARIIVLTQYDDPDLREAARQAGASDYVWKEDLSQLQALLHANLKS
jgi:DNA-binding NarL/FixJ family response regulator